MEREEWTVREWEDQPDWADIMCGTALVALVPGVTSEMAVAHARQIAREHNLHPRLVAGLKRALKRLSRHRGDGYLRMDTTVLRATLRDLLAEAKKGDCDG
jgi:hypothetical protein